MRLVKVAYARNLAEAELIQGLLRQEDIPSMVQRNGGFDVPDFLAAGPRDVLVPESEAERARELLP
jgi:predicted esterase